MQATRNSFPLRHAVIDKDCLIIYACLTNLIANTAFRECEQSTSIVLTTKDIPDDANIQWRAGKPYCVGDYL